MGIQMRRTGSVDYGRYIKALIAGAPGSGKTLMSSTFPNPIYASAEGGLMSVHDRNIPLVDIKTTADLLELKQHLDQPKKVVEQFFGIPIETVVIDTIDEVGRILQKERLAETKKEILAMGDWGWFGDQLRGIIRSFRNLEMHVVFTIHLKTAEDGETGAMFVKPALQGAVGDELPGFVDLALLLQARAHSEIVDGETRRSVIRYLQTYPDTRHPWIKDRSGKLPMEFPVNFEDDYKRLDALIYGGMKQVEESENVQMAAEVASIAQELQVPEPEKTPLAQRFAEEDAKQSSPEPEPQEEAEQEPSPTEETIPASGTKITPDPLQCEGCKGSVENEDQVALSNMRFRKTFCRKCFVAAKKKKP